MSILRKNTILIDADVIMDVLFTRKGFENDSKKILEHCEKSIQGFITPVLCANLHYFLTKEIDRERSIEILKSLLTFLEVLNQQKSTLISAINSEFIDFEDALQHFAAVEYGKIDFIITRNTKDYKKSQIPVFTPKEFLSQL